MLGEPVLRQLRAVVLLLVVVANLTHAIPLPGVKDDDRDDPEWFIADMHRWSGILRHAGVEVEPAALQQIVLKTVFGYRDAVRAIRAPASPVFRALKSDQQWGLFAAVTQAPDRLVIEVNRGQRWEPVFIRLDPIYDWNADLYRFRRIRGIWDSSDPKKQPKGTYRRLARWTAERLFEEDPTVEEVRFVLHRQRLTLPSDDTTYEVVVHADRTHKRSVLMAEELGR